MRYIKLSNVEPGMVLGADIFDAHGRILLGRNAELGEDYINRLLDLGFDGVYIDDEMSAGIDVSPMISPELRNRGIECVRCQDLDGCAEVAREIVNEILKKGSISLDMADLRETDDYTYAHSINVAIYSCVIGMGFAMSEDQLEELVVSGLLHDLGKLAIPAEILNKPGRLTPEEFEIMKSHAKLSYELIKDRWDINALVKSAVLFHHENVDGSGYPRGLKSDEQIPYVKIIHVADVYDALVSKRPYKKPYSAYDACEFMMGACGIMFEEEVVKALLKYVPLYPKGKEMILSDERKCIIVENGGYHNLRPVVRLMDGTDIDLSEREHMDLTIRADDDLEVLDSEMEKRRSEILNSHVRCNLLIVDDMVTNLQLLRNILEPIHNITLVKSGAQAIAYVKKNGRPDAVLLDIDMPQMDGIETAKQLREMTDNELPIIFVSALSDKETVAKCNAIGADGYILRPYKPAFIKSEIKRVLTGRGDCE